MIVKAFLAVRLGSSRVPFKNFRILGGKPLYEHLADTVLTVKGIDDLFINSDSEIVISLAREKYSTTMKYYLRPADLGTSATALDDYVYDFMINNPSDVTLFLNPCSLFLKKESIERAIKYFLSSDLDSCVASGVHQTHCFYENEPINFTFETRQPRSQDLCSVHAMTSGFFLWKNDCFIKTFEKLGYANFCGKFESFPVSQIEAIDIDEEEDVNFARRMLQDKDPFSVEFLPKIQQLIDSDKIRTN